MRTPAVGPDQGSVTGWIDALKLGDDEAASALWKRYFDELVRLARGRLRMTLRTAADEEDVALSAFHSLCEGVAAGRFEKLGGRDDLWRLLVTITLRKALDQLRTQRSRKRGGGRVRTEADLAGAPRDDQGVLARAPGADPPPDVVVLMAEGYRLLMARLGDESLRQVALMRMEGYNGDQIAERLGCNRRTVTRKLELIRRRWLGPESFS
jgi:DNA-directed RNA polymerase specialized sigma24 family protein